MSESSNRRSSQIYRYLLPRSKSSFAAKVGATALSVLYSVKRRSYNRFYWDKDGTWVNRQNSHTVFSPTVRLVDQSEIRDDVLDQWLYRYKPKPGDVIIDVGAGIGEETIYFSRMVGPEGKVISIEAHPLTVACLQKTVRINNLENVSVIHCAVSDTEGETVISDEAIHIQNTIIGANAGVAVPSKTLDAALEPFELATINFVKMNIEGAEGLAIRGMTRVLGRTDYMCISCHDFLGRHMQTRNDVEKFLTQQGYRVFCRGGDPRPWVRNNVYADRGAYSG